MGRQSIRRPLVILLALIAAWFAASLLVTNPYYALLMTIIPIWAAFAMSWNIFSGYSGLISFGHAAFFGLGAYTVAVSLINFDLTPWLGLPLAALVGAGAGAVIGAITFRLSGLYFALAMLAYPLSMIYVFEWVGYQEVTIPMRPDAPLYYMQFDSYQPSLLLALGLLLIASLAALMIERSRFGASLMAIKQNELAAEAAGVNTFAWKMRAMVLSGAIAALAGGLFGTVVLVLTPGSVFGVVVSAQAIILTLFGGVGIVWGPLIGAATLLPLSETLHAELGSVLPGIQGLLYGMAIILVILLAPEGVYWRIRDALTRRHGAAEARAADEEVAPEAVSRSPVELGDAVLKVENLAKSYGGLQAVDDVSFEVRAREIVGIIGPNGAGKTTLFNLLNGVVKPDRGRILLNGTDIAGMKPSRICAQGIGRTFQVVRPFRRMDVLGNVVVGAYVRGGGEGAAWERARAALDTVGLGERAAAPADTLTTKELRLMELARALAADPDLVLLDEPLAGLGADEMTAVMNVVQTLPERGVSVVIIEHSIKALLGLVDRMVVLDHGALLTDGDPAAVTKDPQVIEAYLGKKWAARHG